MQGEQTTYSQATASLHNTATKSANKFVDDHQFSLGLAVSERCREIAR